MSVCGWKHFWLETFLVVWFFFCFWLIQFSGESHYLPLFKIANNNPSIHSFGVIVAAEQKPLFKMIPNWNPSFVSCQHMSQRWWWWWWWVISLFSQTTANVSSKFQFQFEFDRIFLIFNFDFQFFFLTMSNKCCCCLLFVVVVVELANWIFQQQQIKTTTTTKVYF